jgi:hypothetical protein
MMAEMYILDKTGHHKNDVVCERMMNMDKKTRRRCSAEKRKKYRANGVWHAMEYDNIDNANTVMYNECTGMMYSPPYDESELDSYQELSDIKALEKEDDSEHNGRPAQKK